MTRNSKAIWISALIRLWLNIFCHSSNSGGISLNIVVTLLRFWLPQLSFIQQHLTRMLGKLHHLLGKITISIIEQLFRLSRKKNSLSPHCGTNIRIMNIGLITSLFFSTQTGAGLLPLPALKRGIILNALADTCLLAQIDYSLRGVVALKAHRPEE